MSNIPPYLLKEYIQRAEYLISKGYSPHTKDVLELANQLYISSKKDVKDVKDRHRNRFLL